MKNNDIKKDNNMTLKENEGLTETELNLIEIRDKLVSFQKTRFKSEANNIAIEHIDIAIKALDSRGITEKAESKTAEEFGL